MTTEQILEHLKRTTADIFSVEDLKTRLNSGKRLKIKMGADPSRPDLHLGHAVVLRQLKVLQDAGSEIIFVIGDFTGMIGDPTNKSKTRPSLSLEETRKNGQSYLEQVTKILDPDLTTIVYNSEWLNKLNFADVIKLAGKYTLARTLERDDFSKRFKENQPISLHELLYPLVQGYDSVALNCDIEVGGTDQTFNLLVGRELQRDYGQEPQIVMTFPLLVGLDGVEKMSKSLDNYIGITEAPGTMFEKAMKVLDSVLLDYFRLTTDFDLAEAERLIKDDVREAHFVYARELVKIYHSEEAAKSAEVRYRDVAAGSTPKEMKELKLTETSASLIDIIKSAGFASTNSEARRLIEGKGIKVNNEVVTDISKTFTGEQEVIVSKGKSNFVKVIFI